MFGISGGEVVVIIVVILMLFGSDKIPELVRGFAKMISQIKNTTNEIKNEIQKSTEDTGIIDEIKEIVDIDPVTDIKKEIDKTKEDIDKITGPIKRQL